MNHPLQTILDEIDARHRAGERPVVIFDLDGTLYDNRPRTIRIVHALAASLPAEHDRDAAIIRTLGPNDLRYRLEDTLRPSASPKR
ncbi:MAG: HAD family hydrolase [Deltaproteobacteria bacterium]|nr:HAD family hydrolase [Deltaproteobacteria bacterium]